MVFATKGLVLPIDVFLVLSFLIFGISDPVKVNEVSYVHKFLEIFQNPPRVRNFNFTGELLPVTNNGTMMFSCHALFVAREHTPISWPPPKHIPHHLLENFTMNGAAQVTHRYFAEAQNGGRGYTWNKNLIESLGRKNNTCGGYKTNECGIVIEKFSKIFIQGKSGIVFGSQSPWAEAALLAAGAAHITTIEYMNITTNHDKLSTMTPDKVASLFLAGKFEPVDFIFSYSSVEHGGLGRYGDPINPVGDLEAVAQLHCLLKDKGVLFLGVPMGHGQDFGQDGLVWNAHRIYGNTRLSVLLSFWKFIHIEPSTHINQPIFVLQKTSSLLDRDLAINVKSPILY